MKKYLYLILITIFLFSLYIFQDPTKQNAQAQSGIAINVSDNVIAAKKNVALNVNPENVMYEHQYNSANMITNPSFEARWFGGQDRANNPSRLYDVLTGVTKPWYLSNTSQSTIQGFVSGSIDGDNKISGVSSQKISIDPVLTKDVDLEIYSYTPFVAGHIYRAKAQVKGNPGGEVKFRIRGFSTGDHLSNSFTINQNWQIFSFDFTPSIDEAGRTISLRISAKGDIWVDDFIFWDVTDTDSDGLGKNLIERTKEVKPSMLKWGHLPSNKFSLERATWRPWTINYGPPPDFDIGSFLLFTKKVEAIPFITIPPAFTNDNFRDNILSQLETARNPYNCSILPGLVDQLENSYQEHLDFLDYLAAKSGTTYGDLAISQGFSNWSQQFSNLYFELADELWNSQSAPYYMWDCVNIYQNYGNYCLNRMKAMKEYSSWESNYKIGFNNQWGWWARPDDRTPTPGGSAPVIANYTKDYLDFYSDTTYYPGFYAPTDWCSETVIPDDESFYSAVFASNEEFIMDISWQYENIKNIVGRNIEHTLSGVNTEKQCGSWSYNKGIPLHFKLVSIGSAIAILDNFASFPNMDISYANYFIQIANSYYGAIYGYPDYDRRPDWFAFQMLAKADSQILETSVIGSPTWDDPTTELTNLPFIHAYGYKEGEQYSVLIINRDQNNSHEVTVNLPQRAYQPYAVLSKLTSANITDNNDDPDVNSYNITENIKLVNQSITDFANGYSLTVPPFSAYLLQLNRPTVSLAKTVDKLTAASGETITYNLTYTNNTDKEITNAKIEDPVPIGTTYLVDSATDNGTFSQGKVTWNLGSFVPWETKTLEFKVIVQ